MAMVKKPLRNWVAMDPLLRKGGAHGVAKHTLRPHFDVRDALDDYRDWRVDAPAGTDEHEQLEGPQGPSPFLGVLNSYQRV